MSQVAHFYCRASQPQQVDLRASNRSHMHLSESLAEIAAELGPHIIPATVDRALDADIIFFAVGFLHFKEVAAKRPDWTGKIVIDVTNAFMLPAEIQQSELHGRLSSEVNAERVRGAKLVKAFNQLPAHSGQSGPCLSEPN
jgi:8-hydroxy-5-deazaflavin:NADPH oxidoreductase